jgi:hypothetical protein
MKTTELVSFSEFTSNRALRKLQTAHLARLDHEGGSFKEIRITTRYRGRPQSEQRIRRPEQKGAAMLGRFSCRVAVRIGKARSRSR